MSTKFYLTRQPAGNPIDGFDPEPMYLYETPLSTVEFMRRISDYLNSHQPWEFTPMNLPLNETTKMLMLVDRDSTVDMEGVAFWENLLGEVKPLENP